MARQPRLTLPHHPHHIIWRGNNRQAIFADAQDQRVMLALLLEASRQHKVAIHSYVLMTNHLHLLATPTEEPALSLMMQQIGRSYVRLFNQRQSRTGTLFEGRYKSAVVQTERYLLACMVYIDLNPVRAGMVSEPQQYPWSSFSHYAGLQTDPLVTPHPHFWSLGNTPFAREAAYGDLVRAGLSGADERALTHSAQRGGVLAQDDYLAELEKTTQKRLRPGAKGRPFKSEKASFSDELSKKNQHFSDVDIK